MVGHHCIITTTNKNQSHPNFQSGKKGAIGGGWESSIPATLVTLLLLSQNEIKVRELELSSIFLAPPATCQQTDSNDSDSC